MARQVQFRVIDLKTFPTTIIFFSLLLSKLVASDTSNSVFFSACVSNYTESTNNNQTGLAHDKYQFNLQSLLNNLISASASTSLSFYNTTAGKPPNKSYGIYLCRGDATSELCRSCVANLTNWVISIDDNCTESVAYTDYCMLRYAYYSFFGKANDSAIGYAYGKYTGTNSQVYNQTLVGVVERVIRDAAYSSAELFATSEAAVDEHEKVYALAQCTSDIDRGGCSGCLKAAQSYLQHNLSGDGKSAWGMYRSCQLRYDNASFFGVSPAASNLAPSPVSAFLVVTWSLLFVNWLLC